MGVLIQITSLMYIFPYSLSNSVSTRVGNMIGAQKPSKAIVGPRIYMHLDTTTQPC